MKKIFTCFILGLILTLAIALPAIAATSSPVLVTSSLTVGILETSVYGVCPQPYTNTFYAAGRNWIFYLNNDSDFCYKSAVPGSALSAEQVIVADTDLYAVEFSVWYEETTNTVHYARHDMDPAPDEVVYRMGTPGTSGTITWAATEQTVSTTPADLLTWRTIVAVDETYNPWVAWIDTDGTNEKGIVYVEASSTHNGTWTQNEDVSSNWSVTDPALNSTHAWFVNLCPIGSETDLMHLGWTSMDVSNNNTGLYAVTFNVTGNSSDIQNVVVDGQVYEDRPDAFDFYDIGSSIYVVYTDDAGAVVVGVKSPIQGWDEATFAFAKEDLGIVWIPTLSGYKSADGGDDLLCIVHNEDVLYYGLWEYPSDLDEWSWTLTWQTSDENDVISRHNAAYKYSSPVAFTWQVTDDSDTPDTDDVYLWWIDNSNDDLGYYADEVLDWGGWGLVRVLPYVFVGITLVLAAAFLTTGATLPGIIMLVISIIIGIVGTSVINNLIP